MNERVTVVIPAYNASRFLVEAIESVLSQTYSPLEVLVVDDGSSDDTGAIAESFGSPVRCLRQKNMGLSEARNRGISEAQGELIALLDADDYWLPNKLVRQVERLHQSPNAVACFCWTEYMDSTGKVIRQSFTPPLADLVETLLLKSCVIGPPSAALIRRSTLKTIGLFDPEFSQCADWDMWLRLAEVGEVTYVEEPLVRYRIHESNMSKNITLLEKDTFAVLAKFFSSHLGYKRIQNRCYSNHYMIVSGSYLHAGDLRNSIRCGLLSICRYPQNIVRPLALPYRWLTRRLIPKTTQF